MAKRLQKDIEREAFSAAKRTGLQGKQMAREAGMNIMMAEWDNKSEYPPGKPCADSNGAGAKSY